MAELGGRPRLALASASLAAVALIGGWTYAATLQPAEYDPMVDSISALAGREAVSAWVMTTALVLTGIAHAVTASSLPRLGRAGRVLLAGAGLATVGVAALPLPSARESRPSHTVVAAVSFALLAAWPWFALRARRTHRAAAVAAATGVALLALVAFGPLHWPFGLVERLVAGGLVLIPWASAVTAWWAAGHRLGSRRVRGALGFGLLTVVTALAGAAATAVAPVTAQTRHYQAQVSLNPDPFASSTLVAPTVFGDVVVTFPGRAPGIRATPQIRETITDLLARPGVSPSALAPGPLELDHAVRSAALALGLRFLIGALLVTALVTLVAHMRRASTLRSGLRGLAATGLACAVTGSAMLTTYHPDRATGFTSTGVLSTVQANAGLLAEVEARSAEVAPYLTNLVALTNALQGRYTPTEVDQPVALRLLLVSDLHDGNQYPLMTSLVAQEGIDAVVDSGDLTTFGTVQEAEAAGVFTGIESVKVPYFFVRGNHDATSATDSELLDRLAKVPNVVLLQPGKDTFVEARLHGIRIRGVNDTRWFGDSGKGTWVAQQPAIADYRAAFDGEPDPDLLVSHHPVVARDLPAGVAVHGHMHSAFLEGNRIQVGTFTGGGPFTHYVTSEDGGELTGQPSAFDILAFGEDCRVASLTRFRFRNLVEGRPAYDDVSLINGRQVDTRPVDPDRTCSAREPLDVTSVPVPTR